MPYDYGSDPGRNRLEMHIEREKTIVDLYARVAWLLGGLGATTVAYVGYAEGVLQAAVPIPARWLVGLATTRTLLRDHPAPVVQADATRLPVRNLAVDAVTALNVLYHLPDLTHAVHEARRVLRDGGTCWRRRSHGRTHRNSRRTGPG